jgi:hypothetical protein
MQETKLTFTQRLEEVKALLELKSLFKTVVDRAKIIMPTQSLIDEVKEMQTKVDEEYAEMIIKLLTRF